MVLVGPFAYLTAIQMIGQRIDLAQFFENGNPYVFVISDQDFVPWKEILLIEGRRLTLTKHPFDLVFLS